jgi:hypothetical protein
MSAITYTAKRNFIKGSFSVGASDISADGTLDQYGSVSTDFSGLVVSDNIYVDGFDNAANNGWHIVSGSSSSTVIPVTASSLVTESAGNTITIQQYLHVEGESYDLEIGAATLDIFYDVVSAEATSQGGLRQSILQRIDEGWSFKSDFIHDDDLAAWREFTHSVAAKETFVFDPYGTIAIPDDPVSVIMDGKPKWARINRYYWTLSFRVIKQ